MPIKSTDSADMNKLFGRIWSTDSLSATSRNNISGKKDFDNSSLTTKSTLKETQENVQKNTVVKAASRCSMSAFKLNNDDAFFFTKTKTKECKHLLLPEKDSKHVSRALGQRPKSANTDSTVLLCTRSSSPICEYGRILQNIENKFESISEKNNWNTENCDKGINSGENKLVDNSARNFESDEIQTRKQGLLNTSKEVMTTINSIYKILQTVYKIQGLSKQLNTSGRYKTSKFLSSKCSSKASSRKNLSSSTKYNRKPSSPKVFIQDIKQSERNNKVNLSASGDNLETSLSKKIAKHNKLNEVADLPSLGNKDEILTKIQNTLNSVRKTIIKISSKYIPIVNDPNFDLICGEKNITKNEKIIVGEPNGGQSVVEIAKHIKNIPNITCRKIISRSLKNSLMILREVNEATKTLEESNKPTEHTHKMKQKTSQTVHLEQTTSNIKLDFTKRLYKQFLDEHTHTDVKLSKSTERLLKATALKSDRSRNRLTQDSHKNKCHVKIKTSGLLAEFRKGVTKKVSTPKVDDKYALLKANCMKYLSNKKNKKAEDKTSRSNISMSSRSKVTPGSRISSRDHVKIRTLTGSPDLDKSSKRLITRKMNIQKEQIKLDNLNIEDLPPIKSEYPRRDHQQYTSVENTFLFKLVQSAGSTEPAIQCADKNCEMCLEKNLNEDEISLKMLPEEICKRNQSPLNCELGNRRGGKQFNFKKYIKDLQTRYANYHGSKVLHMFPVHVNYPTRKINNENKCHHANANMNKNNQTPTSQMRNVRNLKENAIQKNIEQTIARSLNSAGNKAAKPPNPVSRGNKNCNKIRKNETNNKTKIETTITRDEEVFTKNYSATCPIAPSDVESGDHGINIRKIESENNKPELQKYIQMVEDKFLKTFSLPEKEKVTAYKTLEQEIKNMLQILSNSNIHSQYSTEAKNPNSLLKVDNPTSDVEVNDPEIMCISKEPIVIVKNKSSLNNGCEGHLVGGDNELKKKLPSLSQPTVCSESISFINSLQAIISKQSLRSNLSGENQSDISVALNNAGNVKNKKESGIVKLKDDQNIIQKPRRPACLEYLIKNLELSKSTSANSVLSVSDGYETICEETISDKSITPLNCYVYTPVSVSLCTIVFKAFVEHCSDITVPISYYNTVYISNNMQMKYDKIPTHVQFLRKVSNSASETSTNLDSSYNSCSNFTVSSNDDDWLSASLSGEEDSTTEDSFDVSFESLQDRGDTDSSVYKIDSNKSLSERMIDFLDVITSLSFDSIPNELLKTKMIIFYRTVQHIINEYYISRHYVLNFKYHQIIYSSYIENLMKTLSVSSKEIDTLIEGKRQPVEEFRLMSFKDPNLRRHASLPEFEVIDKMFFKNVCHTRQNKDLVCNQKRINSLCHTMVLNLQLMNQKSNRTTFNSCIRRFKKRRARIKSATARKKKNISENISFAQISSQKFNTFRYVLIFSYLVIFFIVFSCLILNYRCE